MSFSVDGNNYFSVTKSDIGSTEAQWPFDQPFWIIFNQAVGGAWGGTPDIALYPLTTEIDWVRVYQDIQTDFQSIKDTNENLRIYPNPTSDYVKIEAINGYMAEHENSTIKLTDITGKLFQIVDIQSFPATINIKTFPRGVYLISVQQDNRNLKKSIILKN